MAGGGYTSELPVISFWIQWFSGITRFTFQPLSYRVTEVRYVKSSRVSYRRSQTANDTGGV